MDALTEMESQEENYCHFNQRLPFEELNRCAVVFAAPPFLVKISYPPALFNPDFLSALVDRAESQYSFLCHTVGMSRRISKSKEIVSWESCEIRC